MVSSFPCALCIMRNCRYVPHVRVELFSLCYRIVSAAAQEKRQCVGALRKHAGGMFLASDLGGYAAAASIWNYTAKLEPLRQLTQYSAGGFLNRRFKQRFLGGGRSERCLWQIQRGERVAAVKISSARPKAAQKFWAPQQVIAATGKSTSSPRERNLSTSTALSSSLPRFAGTGAACPSPCG